VHSLRFWLVLFWRRRGGSHLSDSIADSALQIRGECKGSAVAAVLTDLSRSIL
jgi:hypothetical protein